jgi:hypothetical protein
MEDILYTFNCVECNKKLGLIDWLLHRYLQNHVTLAAESLFLSPVFGSKAFEDTYTNMIGFPF